MKKERQQMKTSRGNRYKRIIAAAIMLSLVVLNSLSVSFVANAETVRAKGAPEGSTEIRDPWYPTVQSNANDWQLVDGDYRDGQNGATTQVTNKSKSVVIRKNVLPTATENIFTIAMKVRTQTSWADLLDATSVRIQNGNSDSSSKVHYFQIKKTGTNSIPVNVYFMNAPSSVNESSLPGNYKVVYRKTYYLDPSNAGNWFLYFNNPLIGMGDHGGQKQKVQPGVNYYIPIGTYMEKYNALHHAAVARKVTDTMGPGVSYVQGSARNYTQIPGVNGRTSVNVSGDTLTWNIDDDGTIPIGEDYKVVKDTLNGKTVYYREYDLLYDVHLDASDENFVPGKVYPTNKEAHLDYTYDPRPEKDESDYWNDFEESQSPLVFPVPSVKGTLYNLTFKKVDSKTGKPLAGAEFTLSGDYGAASVSGVTAAKPNSTQTAISSAEEKDKGVVTFKNVPWGTYTLKETKAPRGWDITYKGMTRKLCWTTDKTLLEQKDNICWLKSAYIGENGVIKDEPWPEGTLTLKKNITNYEDILSQKDKDTKFDLQVAGFDSSKMVFLDEEGNIVDDGEKLRAELKHAGTSKYTVRIKGGTGTFKLSELLPKDSDLFQYEDTDLNKNGGNSDAKGSAVCTKGNGTESSVKINEGNDITLTVNNKYRLGDVPIQKQDSVTKEGLSGAQFDVYTSEKADAKEDAEIFEYKGATYYKLERTQTSAADGSLDFTKLPASVTRSYVIKEAAPPNGYKELDAVIPFTFNADGKVQMGAVDSGDVNFDSANGVIRVDNHKTFGLPSAGGIGTYVFTFLGALMIALSAFRMKGRNA